MDNQAITPDVFEMPTLDAAPIAETEVAAVELATQDDKELAGLNTSRGWQRIAARMTEDVNNLRTMRGADLKGLSREEVGDKYLISSLVADHLQVYLDEVANATKAIIDHATRK